MHQQFNIQQLYILSTRIYVFCMYLRTNSDLCNLQQKLIGLHNRYEKCLQRGKNWVFNLLKTKRLLLYIRNKSVPRCKHFPPPL
jgi:hypothetical protein